MRHESSQSKQPSCATSRTTSGGDAGKLFASSLLRRPSIISSFVLIQAFRTRIGREDMFALISRALVNRSEWERLDPNAAGTDQSQQQHRSGRGSQYSKRFSPPRGAMASSAYGSLLK